VEGEDLGEPIEVRVTMEHSEATVLCCGGGDQRVGERHAVVAVAAASQLAVGAHRCVGDGAIVAQDAQGVELALQRGELELVRAE